LSHGIPHHVFYVQFGFTGGKQKTEIFYCFASRYLIVPSDII
jgi:hypothetical protein